MNFLQRSFLTPACRQKSVPSPPMRRVSLEGVALSRPQIALLLSSVLLSSSACSTSGDAPCKGAERCECYGNGTCDEGLSCLSNHCVDTSQDAAVEAGPVGTEETETDVDTTDDLATGSDAHSVENGASSKPDVDESDSTEPTTGATVQSTAPASADSLPFDNTSGVITNTDEQVSSATSESTSTMDTGTSSPSSSPETSAPTDATSSTSETSGSRSFPPLPSRVEAALDDESTTGRQSSACTSPQASNDLCYTVVPCASEPCDASFEWTWATVTQEQQTFPLVMWDISGDGTVVVGTWGTSQPIRAFAFRWGKSAVTYLSQYNGFGSALNFDATAAAGSVQPCLNQSCDWEGARFTRGAYELLPEGLNSPYDISDDQTVVGYERPASTLLGTIWSSGEPLIVNDYAFQNISGDGVYVAGTEDGTGRVVLYSAANGIKYIPDTSPLRADATSGVNEDGSVVVGWGWDSQALQERLFLWRTEKASTNRGSVEVVAPAAGFANLIPFAIDATGSVVVGVNRNDSSSAPEETQAFYWDTADQPRPMTDELAARGITVPDGVFLHNPHVSADGSTIIGKGVRGDAPIIWRARLAQ